MAEKKNHFQRQKTAKPAAASLVTGIIRVSARAEGTIFLPIDPSRRDGIKAAQTIIIGTPDLNTALDGDTVEAALHPLRTKNKARELRGEVTKIISRKKTEFVGVAQTENGICFVQPEDRRMYVNIIIPEKDKNGAKDGEKVLAAITRWSDPKKEPLGKILRVIGQPGVHEVEMQSILLERGFRPEFPPEVEHDAESAKKQAITDFNRELERRRDFRGVPTFTIDPVDAKDFDDALSFKEIGPDRYEVGVHIADVSYFVRPGTILDAEAKKRGTSIYLVDRTIPMLPEILSNGMCSLVEHEDRYAFSAVFEIDSQGNIKQEWFGKSVINSDKRFSYEEVQTILDQRYGLYHPEISQLNKLAYALRAKKIEAGAISFEDEEIRFRLDETGKPIDVYKKERTDSHKLVEDFMLLANKRVAEYVSKVNKNKPHTFVYRIHEAPDPEKMLALQEFLRPLGYDVSVKGKKISSAEMNRLLEASIGAPEENMVQRAAVRAMQRAVYSTKNIGHYGLAFSHYTHFTSPIRRYPDLMVHRLLSMYLSGQRPSGEMLAEYSDLAMHCSEMERLATEAERDSVKYKQVEYMQDKVGQEFEGVISGVTEWGIYIEELETKAEGMIRLADLSDDYYVVDEKNFAVVGEKTKKRYRLGDVVKVKVKRADLNRKIIDFSLA